MAIIMGLIIPQNSCVFKSIFWLYNVFALQASLKFKPISYKSIKKGIGKYKIKSVAYIFI